MPPDMLLSIESVTGIRSMCHNCQEYPYQEVGHDPGSTAIVAILSPQFDGKRRYRLKRA